MSPLIRTTLSSRRDRRTTICRSCVPRPHWQGRIFPNTVQRMSRHAALFICCLAGCTTGRPVIYAGALQPLSGTCDSPGRAELSLRGRSVLFTPASGTIVLRGERTGNEVAAQETLVNPERKAYPVGFAGRIGVDGIDGVYETPRCRYHVHLSATQD